MADNYDRRLKARKDWEFEYMGNIPVEKKPVDGDKFYILEDGKLGEELTVDHIGYDIDMGKWDDLERADGLPEKVYGVIAYEDDSRTYEIYWHSLRKAWVVVSEPIQATGNA